MQLRSTLRRQHRQLLPRARREDRSCMSSASRCVSARNYRLKPLPRRAASVRSVARSRDPIGYEGSPFNLHEYAEGRPIVALDPTGEAVWVPPPPPSWWPDWLPGPGDPANFDPSDCMCIIGPAAPVCMACKWTKKMLSTSKVIAKGSGIREVDRLVQQDGGTTKGWIKKKGWDSCGREWHWYEHIGIGKVEEKLK